MTTPDWLVSALMLFGFFQWLGNLRWLHRRFTLWLDTPTAHGELTVIANQVAAEYALDDRLNRLQPHPGANPRCLCLYCETHDWEPVKAIPANPGCDQCDWEDVATMEGFVVRKICVAVCAEHAG